MSTIYGKPLFIGSAKPKLPEIFGTGEDGDLYIAAGETVTLPVAVPHQSIVEMNYTSITIEAGGTLTTSDPNAGLVLRCQGDCVIHGTIDQSGKAPKTNPDSTYPYPEELQCGAGGNGGRGGGNNRGLGGAGMAARPYGGGYGGGGGGGGGSDGQGGDGGDVGTVTILTPDGEMFVGGDKGGGFGDRNGKVGINGGGGGGAVNEYDDTIYSGGAGGNGPGGDGEDGSGSRPGYSGGGAGNTGGGVLMLYVGGNFYVDGTVDCSGKNGGNGGNLSGRANGGGGGGGGGGSIYILYMGAKTVTGSLNVNGGEGGRWLSSNASDGAAGTIGTTTIKQYTEETA